MPTLIRAVVLLTVVTAGFWAWEHRIAGNVGRLFKDGYPPVYGPTERSGTVVLTPPETLTLHGVVFELANEVDSVTVDGVRLTALGDLSPSYYEGNRAVAGKVQTRELGTILVLLDDRGEVGTLLLWPEQLDRLDRVRIGLPPS